MKFLRILISLTLITILSNLICRGQNLIQYSSLIDINRLKSLISWLSDDLTEGRGLGSTGHQMAGSLIIDKFNENSLSHFYSNSYVQSFRVDTLTGRNIVGVVRSKYYSDKYIVISAHYDHLGILRNNIYNGADDNASGVALLLELARVFANMRENREGLNKNLIFVAFDAKENNLKGSEAFIKRLPVDKRKIICNINLDQIGCTFSPPGKNKDYLLVLGANSHKDFKRLAIKAGRDAGVVTELDFSFYGSKEFADVFYSSSDQHNFYKAGIPSLLLTSGVHMHTYKPTDDWYFIDFPVLVNRARLIFNLIYQISYTL
ncbi:MAG: M28 family peptidase [Bacteroidales bacterium]|nr:M28 family peptidase [Bacteroidales bacterium]MDD2424663.1 M28 family peptidase [Bacteroidales bacterium]MDD3989117.1 M28 family peptidase [Bacteroidales bacterium]MDD4638938.1 M28 family peptidase [Bacteroidales bacterium]